jgi:GWxTD domain-containing protein
MNSRTPAILLAALAAAALAVPAGAEMAQLYHDWATGPAQYLFTAHDRDAWKQVTTDAEAEEFIRLFWARRDPTPESPGDNEFRREFERRTAYADQRFAETTKESETIRGAMTDRGRVFIMLGPPRRLQAPGAGGVTGGGDFGVGETAAGGGGSVSSGAGPGKFGRGGSSESLGVASDEIWVYEDEAKPEFIKKKRYEVRFRTKPGTEHVELFQSEDAMAYAAEAAELAVVNPGVTLADLPSGAAATAPESVGDYSAWGAELIAEPATADSLHAALTGKPANRVNAHLDAGAFQASDGTWIVPLQVATLGAPPAGATLVGELVATGEGAGDNGDADRVSFRGEGEWSESKGQHQVKATLVAPPGSYELHAGLQGSGGELLWAATEPVEVPGDAGDFWISEVVLSDNIFAMQQAQQMLEPYAWQGIVVVPKGGRSFPQGDVLWYYLHACQPQIGDDGKPSLRLSVQLTGPSAFGGPVSAQPVKAGDNCWVLAQGLDLEPDQFAPGDYSMKVNVRDSLGKKTLTTNTDFKVISTGG